MHFFTVRAPLARVAAITCVVAIQLATSGVESLLAGGAPLPPAAVAQSSSRSRSRAKPPVRRTSRRTTRGRVAAPAASSAWTSPVGAPALQSDLGGMIGRNVRSGKFGAMVVSLTRGDTLFAQNAGEMMQPASTMKLFSTAVALDRFGPEHRFSTDLLRDGALGADGT
ncbi:MAG TPA: D-alanyl-D-alanine carboxypeptidase, partial [Gemmatimonadaceae bacterium]